MSIEFTYALMAAYAVLNCISFALFGIDKRKAVRGTYRIKESTLLAAGLVGPFGATTGMEVFRHKTKKPKFKVIYVFLLAHLIVLAFLVSDLRF